MADGTTFRAPDHAVPHGLTYCSDEHPGLRRRRAGKGFAYSRPNGGVVRDPATLARVRALAIPPAWTDVWICPQATGHIQATGRDAKGRKQYRYHPDWSTSRSDTKFERMAEFGRALPRLRRQAEADLGARGVTREKVLATAVRVMELTLIRVGNREYARQNRSYGLTTLQKRHLEVDGAALSFAFRGKSGIMHRMSVRDRRLARILRSLRELPGQHLFKYRDADGEMQEIGSADVNAYIREASGGEFSAKDFRTWAGTVSAARALRDMDPPETKAAAKRSITTCVKAVSGLLGNTPTVCRASYVHPRVFDLFEKGQLRKALPGSDTQGFEKALIRMLEA